MRTIRGIAIGVCVALGVPAALAQGVKVSGSMDKNTIQIGQQFHLTLKVEQPANRVTLWPMWTDTITKGVEIVGIVKTDTAFSANKDKVTFTRDYLLTSFDSGGYTIPPIALMATTGRDTETAYTEPLFLAVGKPAVDTTKGIKDIKGPVEIPFDWREYLPYVLGAIGAVILLVAIIFMIVYIVRKRRAKRALVPEPTEPPIPPHIVALQALGELEQKQLWQQGKLKLYYTELTDILRDYIRDVYKINAPELLTEEIVQYLRFKNLTGEQKQAVRAILELADMVKFAKVAPTEIENRESLNVVTAFVQETAGNDGETPEKEKGGDHES